MSDTYRYGGLVIESRLALPELPVATDTARSLLLTVSDEELEPPKQAERYLPFADSGTIYFAHADGGYTLRFEGMSSFRVAPAGDHITYRRGRQDSDATVRHLLLDHVLPAVLSHLDRIVLHAAAVAGPEGALVFLGPAGRGKSTLAAAMVASGARLLSDDQVVIERTNGEFLALGTYPSMRLWGDALERFEIGPSAGPMAHYCDKQRIVLSEADSRCEPDAVPLDRLFVLDEPGPGEPSVGVSRVEVAGNELLTTLMRSAFFLDGNDLAAVGEKFGLLGSLAAAVSADRLVYQRDFAQLDDLVQAVIGPRV